MQGPKSLQVLELLGLPGELAYMSFVTGTGGHGVDVTVCRTGYTGEHGYELLVPAERAGELWDALLDAGQDGGIRLCGLGARDTLRTEMGYPLHGHELSHEITPNQARAGLGGGLEEAGVLGPGGAARREGGRPGPAPVGAARLRSRYPAARHGGARCRRRADRRGHQRHVLADAAHRDRAGAARHGRGVAEGAEVAVDVRGRPQAVEVVRTPFVPSHVR